MVSERRGCWKKSGVVICQRGKGQRRIGRGASPRTNIDAAKKEEGLKLSARERNVDEIQRDGPPRSSTDGKSYQKRQRCEVEGERVL